MFKKRVSPPNKPNLPDPVSQRHGRTSLEQEATAQKLVNKMHELQQNDIEREKKDRVLQEKREQNDAILLENVKRSQDNYRLLPSPSLLPNTTALPPPRLVESQCFNYLFVCAHCTPTITKKIQELKGLTKTKLIVGTAASPYNLCDRDSAAQQNEYGNKINLAIQYNEFSNRIFCQIVQGLLHNKNVT